MTVLKRYSKPREAGDQASGGLGKLLKSNLSRTELLVRETIQNSWDAREDGWRPAYGARLRKLTPEVRRILRQQIFSSDYDRLPLLRRSLEDDNTYALEIYDRGTVGLNGPIRASEAAMPGEPNNFTPLVFDIGTTKDSEDSGGTYGFGKNAAFEASSANTIVYWSATENRSGELEHRLIASTLGDPYEVAGKRYTGAHWWGDPEQDDIMPLTGDAAQELGERLFDVHFGSDEGDPEKGTSILILDPFVDLFDSREEDVQRQRVRTREQAEALVRQICDALSVHAWPKVIPEGNGQTPMIISVFLEDRDMEIEPEIQSRYARYGSALAHVRQEQGEEYSPHDALLKAYPGRLHVRTWPIQLRSIPLEKAHSHREFFGSRRDRIVGHLTLMKSVHMNENDQVARAPMNKLALMRSKAELIVTYDDKGSSETAGLTWHGVFKPTPEVDRHFAAAEPATHDVWKPEFAVSEISRSVVSRTLEQIRKRVSEYLDVDGRPEKDAGLPVKKFANSLAAFTPAGTVESTILGPKPRQPRQSLNSHEKQDLITITDFREIRRSGVLIPDRKIEFSVSPQASEQVTATINVKAHTPEGTLAVDESEFEVQWFDGQNLIGMEKSIIVEPGFSGQVVLSIPFTAEVAVSLMGVISK